MILRFLYRNYLSLALLFAAAGPAMAAGTQAGSLEISVKAAFLPKFAAYVNWPPSVMGAPDDPLQLCVIGRDPFGPRLDEAASRQHIDQHPILVRHLETTEGAAQCHIAFVGGSAMAEVTRAGVLEISVKAAFLPKFAAYVNWPPRVMGAPDDPLQLCVIGREPFGPRLDEAASRQHIDQHPILVRHLENTEGAEQCHIAFVGGSAKQSAEAMLTALQGQPILTVTDDRLGPQRGIVHFILKDGRVRFHIDDTLSARSNLNISAKLLSLAVSVKPRGRA